jgi:hypothetical protein
MAFLLYLYFDSFGKSFASLKVLAELGFNPHSDAKCSKIVVRKKDNRESCSNDTTFGERTGTDTPCL